ncbi:hypothetical protein DUNSADRAFT_8529, partial [Dunaliella salina]
VPRPAYATRRFNVLRRVFGCRSGGKRPRTRGLELGELTAGCHLSMTRVLSLRACHMCATQMDLGPNAIQAHAITPTTRRVTRTRTRARKSENKVHRFAK